MKYNEQIDDTFGKGDTAEAVPQAARLHSMTFVGKNPSSSFATRTDEKNVSDVLVHWKCTSRASSLQTRTRWVGFIQMLASIKKNLV